MSCAISSEFVTLMSSRLDPEIRRQGMWCHLFGLSSALWIFAWILILATGSNVLCRVSYISPIFILMIVQAKNDLQTLTQPLNACFWIIPLLMLLLGPLVTLANWLHKRNFHTFVDAQGKESFNFQLSVSICVLLVLFFFNLYLFQTSQSRGTLGLPTERFAIGIFVALAFFPLLTVFQVILVIFAASKAANGQNYRYPFTMRFFK